MLTSQVVLCLNKFNLKTNLTSSDIETALRKAGIFLFQNSKKTEHGARMRKDWQIR